MRSDYNAALANRVKLGVLMGKIDPTAARALGYDVPEMSDPRQQLIAQKMEADQKGTQLDMMAKALEMKMQQQSAQAELQMKQAQAQQKLAADQAMSEQKVKAAIAMNAAKQLGGGNAGQSDAATGQ